MRYGAVAAVLGYIIFMHVVHGPETPKRPEISFDTFLNVDLRVGTIIHAEVFKEARKPAIKMNIDFGETLGILRSSAQITEHYSAEALVGRQVVAVVNFPPRQIGPLQSQVLVIGAPDEKGQIVLLAPDTHVPNGSRLS